MEAITSYTCLALYILDALSKSHSYNLGSASSHLFHSMFLQCLSCMFCTSSSHCQCFDHSFLFASQRSNNLASCSSFFRICAPLLHLVGFVILWRSAALPSALLIILSTFRRCISSMFPFSSFFFMCSSHSYHFCMVSSHPVWTHAFSQSVASNSETHRRFLASILLFDLILFIRSFVVVIVCCCFISSTSDSSCLLCRRCKLYSAQQSSHHLLILHFLFFLCTLEHSRGAPLPLKASLLRS